MIEQIARHIHFLSLLSDGDDKQRLALLKTMNLKQFKIVIECIYNVLYGMCTVSNKDKTKMKSYKDVIRRLTLKDITREHRKK